YFRGRMRPWSVTNCLSKFVFLKSSASTVQSILGLGRGVRTSAYDDRPRVPRRSGFSGRVFRGIVGSYLISRCRVWRRNAGLYFFNSSFSVLVFLLRVVV